MDGYRFSICDNCHAIGDNADEWNGASCKLCDEGTYVAMVGISYESVIERMVIEALVKKNLGATTSDL